MTKPKAPPQPDKVNINPDQIILVPLSGKTIMACLQGLAEIPWHMADPAMKELQGGVFRALQPQDLKPAPSRTPRRVNGGELAASPPIPGIPQTAAGKPTTQ